MFGSRGDSTDDEVRERFARVVGLPEIDDEPIGSAGSVSAGSGVPGSAGSVSAGSVSAGSGVPGSADSGVPAGSAGVGGGGLRGALGVLDPGRRGARALAVVAVLAVAVAGFFAWQARPQVEPVGARPESSAEAASSSAAAPVVVVAVTGRVQRPGLIRLPPGARVADAIDAAGGALPGTDLTMVNLARKLTDGELVTVGVTPPAGAEAGVGGGAPGAAPGALAGPLNLNTATAAQLEALPGIGPVLAQHIVEYRTRHGRFRSVDELRQVDGLGAARFKQLKPLVTV
jgi:competence protein ComEA